MSTLDWSDDEIIENNDIKPQPSRELPPSDDEDDFNYNQIVLKRKDLIDLSTLEKKQVSKQSHPKIKKKEVKLCLSQISPVIEANTKRKFNPRFPPPNKI